MANIPLKMDNKPRGAADANASYQAAAVSSPRVPPDHELTEVGLIPENLYFGEIGDLNPFVTSGSRGWAQYYSNRGSAFLRITNLSRESIYIDLSDLKLVRLPPTDTEGLRTQLQDGDLLVSITADIGIIGFVDPLVPKPAYINQHIALVRFDATKTDSKFLSYFLASERPQRAFRATTDQGAKAGMNLMGVRRIRAAFPPLPEQRAIAAALSDVDALLAKFDALIAKKRDLKQAAMQQLLTGQTRLPRFSGGWEVKRLGDVSAIKTGKRNNEDKVQEGEYPFFVRSQTVERINSYSFEGEAILVPGEGGIGSIFHYIVGKCDYHQRVYKISNFSPEVCGKFIFFCMTQMFNKQAMQNSVKATVDSLRLPTFQEFEFRAPSLAEQTAIATVLSNIDAEIAALGARRNKTRALKQGMMQELLTGRIRLV